MRELQESKNRASNNATLTLVKEIPLLPSPLPNIESEFGFH